MEFEKRPCQEVIEEVREFLTDLGWSEVIYWDDSKQMDGVISKEIEEGEVTYHIVIDFVENKLMLEVKAETEEEIEDYEIEYWESIPQAYDSIIALMQKYGIYKGLPPKPKWKKLKLTK